MKTFLSPCRFLTLVALLALIAGHASATPRVVGYFNGGQQPDFFTNAATAPYTHLITGFLAPNPTDGSLGYDNMGTWTWDPVTGKSTYNPTLLNQGMAQAIQSVQSQGIKVLLSFGGDTNNAGYLHWANNPSGLAQQIAGFVTSPSVQSGGPQISFDGIDLDYEDTAALQYTGPNTATQYNGVNFMVELTEALRTHLPADTYLLTHAPQSAYLFEEFAQQGLYRQINAQAGSEIDFYNVQFYNTPAYDGGGTIQGVVDAYGSVLSQNPSLPASKTVLGLPMAAGMANDNIFSLQDQAQIYSQAVTAHEDFGGAMGWQIFKQDDMDLGPAWANAVSEPLLAIPEPSSFALLLAFALVVLLRAFRPVLTGGRRAQAGS